MQGSRLAPCLPSIAAVTEEQAVLPVTAAAHLAEGRVLLLLFPGPGILHWDLRAEGTLPTRYTEPNPEPERLDCACC